MPTTHKVGFKISPHEEAVALLKDKAAVTRKVWDAMLPELRARAFTVAILEETTAIQRVRDAVAELPAGGDWNTLKKKIADEFSPHSVDPSADEATQAAQRAASEARANLILRTNGFDAYEVAQNRALLAQTDVMPDWQWQTAGDDKVRVSHAALDGKVFPANSPFWEKMREWGCRCWKRPISRGEKERLQAADADKAPGDRRVLTEKELRAAEKGVLTVGPETAARIAKLDASQVEWSETDAQQTGATIDLNKNARPRPGAALNRTELAIPLESLRGQHDAAVWGNFEQIAKRTDVGGGKTLWELLSADALRSGAEQTLTAAGGDAAFTRGVQMDMDSALGEKKAAQLRETMDSWVDRSGDAQEAAGEDLRTALTIRYGGQVRGETAAQLSASASPSVKALGAVLDAQYNATQVALARVYPSGKVKLYRGVPQGAQPPFDGMTSWTLDRKIAESYAAAHGGVVLVSDVDIADIWASPFSNSALRRKKEAEFMVLTRDNNLQVKHG